MTARRIIIPDALIPALERGDKTQHRVLLKPSRKITRLGYTSPILRLDVLDGMLWWWDGVHERVGASQPYPFAVGDRLWVAETWKPIPALRPGGYFVPGSPFYGREAFYESERCCPLWADAPWRSPATMPQALSRFVLTVTDVRVQRVQDVTDADAMAEGATMRPNCCGFMARENGWSMDWSRVGSFSEWAMKPPGSPRLTPLKESDISLSDPKSAFANYWTTRHGPDAWDRNDWVIVPTFGMESAVNER